MKILTIYTANKNFISLRMDSQFFSKEIAKNTSESLMPEIAELLKTHNIKPNELDLIFVCKGVGSFTGLRIGLTVAKTLAQLNNVKLAGFFNLSICTGVKAYAGGAYVNEKSRIIYINNRELEKLKTIEWEDEINLIERADKLAVKTFKEENFEDFRTLDCVYVEKSQAERELEKDIKNITVKTAALEDINKLLEIENLSFNYNVYSKETFGELINSKNKYVFKMEFRNEICGYIVMQKVDSEVELLKIAITPKHRRKGFSKFLFNEAIRILKPHEVCLEVHKNNAVAISLYKKLMFKETGVRKNYYDDGSDAVVMKMIICK